MFKFPKPLSSEFKAYDKSWDFAYGPVASRRFGRSLGINPFGREMKVCSYDCPYCELGPTEIKMNQVRKQIKFAQPSEIVDFTRDYITALQKQGLDFTTMCISGLGEPTLYPELAELIDGLLELRRNLELRCPMVLLTNGAHFEARRLTTALNQLNETHVKLDAGSDKLLKAINSPIVRITVSKLIGLVRPIENLVVQSMFVTGALDNTKPEDLDEWFEAVGIMKPHKVHICTLDRAPTKGDLKKVAEDSLYTIGSLLKRKTGIDFEVFA